MLRTVLINAGPWLPVPPGGYGGIENVVATLVPVLRRRGVRVLLASVGESTLEVDRLIAPFPGGMFAAITSPYNQAMGIAHAHMGAVADFLRSGAEPVDLVHDHLEVVGPSVLAALGETAPPALHTLHWDLAKHPDFYATWDGAGRIHVNGVSESQLARAPARLREQALGAVPLATDVEAIPFTPEKGERFLCLARIAAIKGPDIAARLAGERGWGLDLAGPVAAASTPAALAEQDPRLPDVAFHHASVAPLLDGERVRWIGAVEGAAKLRLLGGARALLCPVRWDEPGGTAVVEALACGTPVVAFARGVMPSLIEHGVTGFLADDEERFAHYAERVGEIDPAACRAAAEDRFSPAAMGDAYLGLYAEAISRARSRARPG